MKPFKFLTLMTRQRDRRERAVLLVQILPASEAATPASEHGKRWLQHAFLAAVDLVFLGVGAEVDIVFGTVGHVTGTGRVRLRLSVG